MFWDTYYNLIIAITQFLTQFLTIYMTSGQFKNKNVECLQVLCMKHLPYLNKNQEYGEGYGKGQKGSK